MADVPNCPRGREEQYLARAAGLDNDAPENPWSREEAYLAAIGNRIGNAEEDISELDQKVAALATDISLKGSVESYDDLPEDAAVGDAYITEDTGILYVWVGDKWTPLNMEGGSATVFYFDMGQGDAGFVKNTTVSLYKDFGLTEPATGPDVFAAVEAGTALFIAEWVDIVEEEEFGRYRWATYIPHFIADDGMDGQGEGTFLAISDTNKTAEWGWSSNTWRVRNVYLIPTVVQNTGASQTDVMSQNATTGMVYQNTTSKNGIWISPNAYVKTSDLANGCVSIGNFSGSGNNQKGGNFNARNCVVIGTNAQASNDDVIAIGQGASSSKTSAIVIGKNASAPADNMIAIGENSSGNGTNTISIGKYAYGSGSYSVNVGESASTNNNGGIAIGAYSHSSAKGEMNIGTSQQWLGYNNTNYRLITGVHDPQAAHDAATKGYVDTHLGGLSFVALTQNEYDALATKDPNTLYIIKAA